MCQTIKTSEGLIFYMQDLRLGRRYDLTLYTKSGLNGMLEKTLVGDEKKYFI